MVMGFLDFTGLSHYLDKLKIELAKKQIKLIPDDTLTITTDNKIKANLEAAEDALIYPQRRTTLKLGDTTNKLTGVVALKNVLVVAETSSLDYCLQNATNLTEFSVPGSNLSNVVSINSMFSGCSALTKIDFTSASFSSLKSTIDAFKGCSSLTNFSGIEDFGKGLLTVSTVNTLDLSDCPLTYASLASIIEKLYDITAAPVKHKIIFGSANLAKLDATEIMSMISKGWEVS